MHDVAFFEGQGCPSVALLSSAFLNQAHYQAGGLGLKQVTGLLIPVAHPISDQTVGQLHAKGDLCFKRVVQALLHGAEPFGLSEEGDAAPSDCMA